MALATSIQLLPQTSFNVHNPIQIGETKLAAGYYTNSCCNGQTVSWHVTGLVGTVTVQASLLKEPTETDWFDLFTITGGTIEAPLTEAKFKNIDGNFVTMRAKVTDFIQGVVQNVKVTY